MAGLMDGFDVGQAAGNDVGAPNKLSGSGDSSAASHIVQASVAGKPKELAERAGESGDSGDAAESEVKSVPKSSVSKRTGEKSE